MSAPDPENMTDKKFPKDSQPSEQPSLTSANIPSSHPVKAKDDGANASHPQNSMKSPEERSRINIILIMSAIGLAAFLATLDITILTTALETISSDLHSSAGFTWIGSSYLLTTTASTPIWGKVSDIFGRKPILLVANVVFFTGSLIAGLSINIGMLLAARAVQGIGSGGLLVLANICIGDLFSPRRRGAYYSIIGAVWAVANSVGPLLGGVFTTKASWHSAPVVCLLVFGLVAAVLFVPVEIRFAKHPIVPMRIFKQTSNWASLGVCFFHAFTFIAANHYLPLYFQAVLGTTPLQSGIHTLAISIPTSISSVAKGLFIRKTGLYIPPILLGFFVMALAFGLFTDLSESAGIGIGPNFAAPLIALQSSIKPQDIATATATFDFTRTLSNAISIVAGGVIVQNELARHGVDITGSEGAFARVQRIRPHEERTLYAMALQRMWILYICTFAAGLALSVFYQEEQVKHKTYRDNDWSTEGGTIWRGKFQHPIEHEGVRDRGTAS